MKKLFALILTLCLLAGSSLAIAEELDYNFKIGYALATLATEFQTNVYESLKAACEEKGTELIMTVDDRDASKMKTAIDTFVLQECDFIVDFSVLIESGSAIATDLKKEGIPMMGVDAKYENGYFFGVDNAGAGNMLGEYAANYATENWDGKFDAVQVLYSEASGENVKQRVGRAAETLIEMGIVDEANVTYTNVSSQGSASVDVTYTRSLVVDYLTAHPDCKHVAIITYTDEAANAADVAVNSSGRTDDVAIFSHGCDVAVLNRLQKKEGNIVCSMNYNSKGYGAQILDACAQVMQAQKNGEEIGEWFYNKIYVVDQNNVWDYYPEAIEG